MRQLLIARDGSFRFESNMYPDRKAPPYVKTYVYVPLAVSYDRSLDIQNNVVDQTIREVVYRLIATTHKDLAVYEEV